MGTVAIKIKIMPTSPDVNLEEIKEKSKEVIEKNSGENCKFEEEPIAFGLKAVIATFALDEEKGDADGIEKALGQIETVNSSQIIDMRRVFG